MIRDKYYQLLKSWCDELISLQIKDKDAPDYLKGAIICPACKMIHGRIADSIYPLIYLYDRTKDPKYLQSADLLFEWSRNMLADDGSYYNDAQNDWNGITVFFVSMLARTLLFHSGVLPKEMRKRFEKRLMVNMEWVSENINDDFETNINYHAATAEAMALCWKYFKRDEYKQIAKRRMEFCMPYINQELFLTGESHPLHYASPRGLKGVDIGYNLEESLPALYESASVLKMKWIVDKVTECAYVHRRFILPDGGMDDSFGSRNYKWTYWGSRTSDGYLAMFERMGKKDETFLQYKYSVYDLLSMCSQGGLLYGGVDLKAHGEYPCIHHTFCKAKAVTALLDGEVTECEKRLEIAKMPIVYHYNCLLSDQIFYKGFYALVTSNDVFYLPGGHISGGMISFLWHEATGPLIAASMMKYSLYEVTNTQLSLTKGDFKKQSFRYEIAAEDSCYSSDLDTSAKLFSYEDKDKISVIANGNFRDMEGNIFKGNSQYEFSYAFEEQSLFILCKAQENGRLHLPLIASHTERINDSEYVLNGKYGGLIKLRTNGAVCDVKRSFNFVCGFYAYDLEIEAPNNEIEVKLEIVKDV